VPLDLPNLDDLTWQQLAELGRSLIPGWAPEWTNHNASDPGITLVELFAYLTEILIYRVNRISAANMRAFLRLINGPEWNLAGSLDYAKRWTLHDLHKVRRAVTAADFEELAKATNEAGGAAASEKVARVKAIFRRDLAGESGSSVGDAPGYVSVIVVPDREGGLAEPSPELLEKVQKALDPARLLTTRLRVVKPRYLTFTVRATLVISTTLEAGDVGQDAMTILAEFFDPLKGGPRADGWPFGRSVYVSEIYELLAGLPGVKLARRSVDLRTQRPIEELAVPDSEAGRRVLNQDQKLEAIRVDPDELVCFKADEAEIAVVHAN
jgi:hypothetical protein